MSVCRIFGLGMTAVAAIFVMLMATLPAPVQLGASCAPAEAMLRWLRERYDEAPHMRTKAGSIT